jgi:tetratricopeptide (TPR) repeat protein
VKAYEFYVLGREAFLEGTDRGLEQAAGYFAQAYGADSRFALAYAAEALTREQLALLRARQGFDAKSIGEPVQNLLNRAHDLGKADPRVLQTVAEVLFLRGDTIKAFDFCRLSLLADPMNDRAWLLRWKLKGGGDPDHPDLRQALELNPYSLEIRLAAAEAFIGKNKYPEALVQLTRAYDIAPGNIQVLYDLGSIYVALWRPEEACAAYAEILVRAPLEADAAKILCELYYETERFGDCLRIAESFLSLRPDSVLVRFLYGVVLLRSGRTEDAESELQKAAALNPNSGFYAGVLSYLSELERLPGIGTKAAEFRR